jgi:hypothetical protein
MSVDYQIILNDLTRAPDTAIDVIPPPYEEDVPFDDKFKATLRAMNRATRIKNRSLLLLNAYYLGKLLEDSEESLTKRRYYSSQLSQYYRLVSVRLYYLYEYLGPRHILSSTRTTLTNIRDISSAEYMNLVDIALNIFNGVENLEGE